MARFIRIKKADRGNCIVFDADKIVSFYISKIEEFDCFSLYGQYYGDYIHIISGNFSECHMLLNKILAQLEHEIIDL